MCLITVNGLYLRESRRNWGWKFQRGLEGQPFGGNFFFFKERQPLGTARHSKGATQPGSWWLTGTALLEKSSARVGKWGKKRHQDWSELGSVLVLGTFNYPGHGFTCLIQYQAQTKHIHSRVWKVKQDINVTHPLPDLNGYSESHLSWTHTSHKTDGLQEQGST